MNTKPWETEPNSIEEEVHGGYKVLMLRGPGMHWCGYVGIPPTHPWFGKNYNDKVKVPQSIFDRPIDIDKVGAINIFCASISDEDRDANNIDIVLAIDVHGGLTYSKDHSPGNEPDGLWWFGFDCAHVGDYCPQYEKFGYNSGGVYRDIEYVKAECGALVSQLAAIAGTKDNT